MEGCKPSNRVNFRAPLMQYVRDYHSISNPVKHMARPRLHCRAYMAFRHLQYLRFLPVQSTY